MQNAYNSTSFMIFMTHRADDLFLQDGAFIDLFLQDGAFIDS